MAKRQICGACGGKQLHVFSGEDFSIDEQTIVSDLSGLRCSDCGEIYLDASSQKKYVNASNAQVIAQRKAEQKELARIRKKLKLTQNQAARLTGGGHNAFGRYERGEARPMPAVLNLFRILDAHPELLKEITR
ncbi:type II toxin-antitoxin system MqsA family antitoxin [Paracandidimonas soli]|uniref:type II toxin-antitoxin system MqsA family antitoxin n=1 Tax=Paracandidimonas soli TaxID=1917182 RepID=UPI00334213C3